MKRWVFYLSLLALLPFTLYLITTYRPGNNTPHLSTFPNIPSAAASLSEFLSNSNSDLLRTATASSNLPPGARFIDTAALTRHIKGQCARLGLPITWSDPDEMKKKESPAAADIVVPEYNILYVSNPKTGSTSFKKWVHRLLGDTLPYDEMLHVHAHSRDYLTLNKYQKNPEKNPQNLTKGELVRDQFYVVGFLRNPITRLISGYRNKVVRDERKQFLASIFDYLGYSTDDPAVIFSAFIDLLLRGDISDHHFTGQWNHMKVCTFPYDLLGQTEFTHESIAVLQASTDSWEHEFPGSRTETGLDVKSTLEEVDTFMRMLTQEQRLGLYEFYSKDFTLLGYTLPGDDNFPYIDLDKYPS